MAELNFDRFTKVFEGPVYVAVGAGVLGFQRAQVWRRALQRRLLKMAGAALAREMKDAVVRTRPEDVAARLAPLAAGVPRAAAGAATRLAPVAYGLAGQAADRLGRAAGEAAGRLGPVLSDLADGAAQRARPLADQVGEHLPAEARELVDAAGDLVTDIPGEARELLKEAAAFGRLALQMLKAPASRPTYP